MRLLYVQGLSSANESSPLVTSNPLDIYGGLLPWPTYNKLPEAGWGLKCPSRNLKGGRVTFGIMLTQPPGLNTKYGKMAEYKKKLKGPGDSDTHKVFLVMRTL